MSLTWDVRIDDHASAPAGNIARALQAVETRLLAIRGPLKQTFADTTTTTRQAEVATVDLTRGLGRVPHVAVQVEQAMAGMGRQAQRTRVEIGGLSKEVKAFEAARKREVSQFNSGLKKIDRFGPGITVLDKGGKPTPPTVFDRAQSFKFIDQQNKAFGASAGADQIARRAAEVAQYNRELMKLDPFLKRASAGATVLDKGAAAAKASGGGRSIESLLPRFFLFYEGLRAVKLIAGAAEATVASFFRTVIEQSGRAAEQTRTLQVALKSYSAANGFRRTLNGIADVSSAPAESIQAAGARFVQQGRNVNTATQLSLAISDLTAGSADPKAYAHVADVMSHVLSGGSVNFDRLNKATGGRLSRQALVAAVQARFGNIGKPAANRMLLGPRRAYALQEALQYRATQLSGQAGGPLGALGQSYAKDLPGAIGELQRHLEGLFSAVNRQPLTDFLNKVNGQLGETSQTTRELRSTFDETFNGVLRPWLQDYKGGAGTKRLTEDLKLMRRLFDGISVAAEAVSAHIHNITTPLLRLFENKYVQMAMVLGYDTLQKSALTGSSLPSLTELAIIASRREAARMTRDRLEASGGAADAFLNSGRRGLFVGDPVAIPRSMDIPEAFTSGGMRRQPAAMSPPTGAQGNNARVDANIKVAVERSEHDDDHEMAQRIARRTAREMEQPLSQLRAQLTGG